MQDTTMLWQVYATLVVQEVIKCHITKYNIL
jgi:hypothetical protein